MANTRQVPEDFSDGVSRDIQCPTEYSQVTVFNTKGADVAYPQYALDNI